MDVTIENRPGLRGAGIEHRGAYQHIGQAFTRLNEVVQRTRFLRERPTLFALYHDDPERTPEAELRSHAAVSVAEGVGCPAELAECRIPSGRYAKLTHVGPYSELPDAWSQLLGTWLPSSGERHGPGPRFEIYVNTMGEAPPEQLITELYVPLA